MALPITAVKTIKKAVEKAKDAAADSDANPEESKGFTADAATCALAPGPGSPTACYVEKTDRFHYFTPTGRWASLSKQNYMDHIGRKGGGAGWSQKSVERLMVANREKRPVIYAGPVPGRKVGIIPPNDFFTKQALCTDSATPMPPIPGDWGLIRAVMHSQLVAGETPEIGATQWNVFHAWMQRSYTSLRDEELKPQQALFLVGPRNCHKSYLQVHLITPVFGGGQAAAFEYLSGAKFNGEFLEAFHLYWMDEQLPEYKSAQEVLTTRLKQLTSAVGTTRYEDKGLKAVNLPTMHRVSVSINDDHKSLASMPSLSHSMKDKLLLLRCSPTTLPMPNTTPAERRAFDAKWSSQLPAYVHWLLEEFEPPTSAPDMREFERYAVQSFRHPDVVSNVEASSIEADLLAAIDAELFPEIEPSTSALPAFNTKSNDGDEGVSLSSKALRNRLDTSMNQFVRSTAKKVLSKGNSLLPVLKQLAETYPDRVRHNEKLKRKDLPGWTFFRAPDDD